MTEQITADDPTVHVGKDGYLFLKSGAHGVFSFFTGKIDPPKEAPQTLVSNLKARKAYCDKTGRLFRMVVFPEKCVALRDKITEEGTFTSLYQRYYSAAVDASPVKDVLHYPIASLDGQTQAFSRTDTHYGIRGDLAVTQDITRDIFPDLQDKFAEMTQPLIAPQEGFVGDLGRKLSPPASETRDRLRAQPVHKVISSNGMKGGNNGIMILLESPNALTDKTLLIYGDSFFRQLLHHLCIFYRRVIFCRTRFFHYEMVEAFQPDHIFCGVAERYLSDVLPDAERPHFLSFPLVLGRALEPDEKFPALWRKFVHTPALTHASAITEPAIPETQPPKRPNSMNLDALDVNQTIDDKDGMSKGMIKYYFATGRSAMAAMKKTMQVAGRTPESITRVLDYACGYGRVLRWLQAAFPQGKIIGVDMDARAVASARETLGADARELDITLAGPIDDPVDLIWVGSLFTHLDEAEALRVLKYLHDHLLPGGLAVITTHGVLVEDRMRSRERVYNLSEDGVVELLRTYDGNGYGFAPYDGMDNYGISLVSEAKMTELIQDAGMEVIHFEPEGWVKHQDVFGIRRPA